jgi:hypothetical protein
MINDLYELKVKTDKRKMKEEERSKSVLRLQMMTDSLKVTTCGVEDVRRKLEREKNVYTDTMAKRVGLDIEIRGVSEDIRHGLDEKVSKEKVFDKLKRDLRRKQMNCDGVKNSLPAFVTQIEDLDAETKQKDAEIKKQVLLLDEIQAEVDLFIGAYFKTETHYLKRDLIH